MKSLGICYWCVKIPQGGDMEHALEYITFYVKKHMAYLGVCSGPLPLCDQPLGAPAYVGVAY